MAWATVRHMHDGRSDPSGAQLQAAFQILLAKARDAVLLHVMLQLKGPLMTALILYVCRSCWQGLSRTTLLTSRPPCASFAAAAAPWQLPPCTRWRLPSMPLSSRCGPPLCVCV